MVNLAKKILLAPLAGISDRVFRQLCREQGADIVVSEMVSADGLVFGSRATQELLRFDETERPIGIQLFGSDPAVMAQAARMVYEIAHPDFIDLNAGCPVRKVVGRNGGAALLQNLPLFSAIVRAMVDAVPIPVTVKIRSGWATGEWVDTEFARSAQDNGAAALTLHARSKNMAFSGHALWERIEIVKKCISIPLIGNGDVDSPVAAARMFEQTGCDSIMVGRAAMGAPWLFAQIQQQLATNSFTPISIDNRVAFARRHIGLFAQTFGDAHAAREMKKHVAWYTRGVVGASRIRDRVFRSESHTVLLDLLDELTTSQTGDVHG